jgi:hypothetical protein
LLGTAGHLLREREAELLPDDEDPRDDFEPDLDDVDEPPEREPETDFLADDPPERPLLGLFELLFDELLFDDEDREPPPVLDDDEPRLDDEREEDEPEDFLVLPDDELFFEPDDELLLPDGLLLDVLLPEERDEPDPVELLLDVEPARPPLFDDEPERPFPPPELLRGDDDELPLLEPPCDPPLDASACVPAIADCTTVAAPSTAPIAAPATMLPAASAAFESRPLFFRLPEDRFDELFLLDEPLFFDFVVAISFPMFEIF